MDKDRMMIPEQAMTSMPRKRKGKARIGPPGFPFDPFGNSMALLQISNHSNYAAAICKENHRAKEKRRFSYPCHKSSAR